MKNITHEPSDTLEYSKITDNIFIGTNQCCQTHFEKELLDKGITIDISLEAERFDAPKGVEHYITIPVIDHAASTQEQLDFGVSVMEMLLAQNKRLYVHCMNGHGRAPTLVSAYFMKQGVNPEVAISQIKEVRSSIHLNDVQIEALDQYYLRITK